MVIVSSLCVSKRVCKALRNSYSTFSLSMSDNRNEVRGWDGACCARAPNNSEVTAREIGWSTSLVYMSRVWKVGFSVECCGSRHFNRHNVMSSAKRCLQIFIVSTHHSRSKTHPSWRSPRGYEACRACRKLGSISIFLMSSCVCLPHTHSLSLSVIMSSKTGLSALNGTGLVAAITSVCSSGFLLFGYDQGVMSGVVISKYWLETMGNPSSLMIGTITALYDVGAVIGAIAAAFTAEPLGRKRTFLLGTIILIIGTILMGSAYGRAQMVSTRVSPHSEPP